MKDQVLGQMMVETSEEVVSRGIGRGGIVIYHFKTVFADQIRAACQVELKLLAKRILNSVLRVSDRR